MAKLSWNEKVRKAVHADGRSLYRLAIDAGLRISPLQRFAAGTSDLTLASAEKLGKVLGLDLVVEKRKR